SVNNPTVNGNQFCFTVNESDIAVADTFGQFELSSTIEFSLDCGDPYDITITDNAIIDVCPTIADTDCLIEECSPTGDGFAIFDLTQADADFLAGTSWTSPADVDISYYETQQ